MTTDEKIAHIWSHSRTVTKTTIHLQRRPEEITVDGDPVNDRLPTNVERTTILAGTTEGRRRAALYRCVERAYEAGLHEGRGYTSSPDLVTRRLLHGLAHVVSHVHHHCKHGSDGLEGFDGEPDEGDDTLPTGKSPPIAAGSRLSRSAWKRCRKDPCSGLVQIVSDCRLWDALNSPVRESDLNR